MLHTGGKEHFNQKRRYPLARIFTEISQIFNRIRKIKTFQQQFLFKYNYLRRLYFSVSILFWVDETD